MHGCPRTAGVWIPVQVSASRGTPRLRAQASSGDLGKNHPCPWGVFPAKGELILGAGNMRGREGAEDLAEATISVAPDKSTEA